MYAWTTFVHTKPYDLLLLYTKDLVNVFMVLEKYFPRCMFQTFAYAHTHTVLLNFILFGRITVTSTKTLQTNTVPFRLRCLSHTHTHINTDPHTHTHIHTNTDSLSHTSEIPTHTLTHTPHGDDRWTRTKNTARAWRSYRWGSRSHSPNTVSISKPWRRTRTSWIALTSSNAALSSRSLCIFMRLFLYAYFVRMSLERSVWVHRDDELQLCILSSRSLRIFTPLFLHVYFGSTDITRDVVVQIVGEPKRRALSSRSLCMFTCLFCMTLWEKWGLNETCEYKALLISSAACWSVALFACLTCLFCQVCKWKGSWQTGLTSWSAAGWRGGPLHNMRLL